MNIEAYKGTDLFKIETFLTESSGNLLQIRLNNVKSRAASRMASNLARNPGYATTIGGFYKVSGQEQGGGTINPCWLKQQYDGATNLSVAMRTRWKTFNDFCVDLTTAAKAWEKLQRDEALARISKESNATDVIRSYQEIKIESTPLMTGINSVVSGISAPDIEFLYSNLRKDGQDNLYWKFKNSLQIIPLAETSSGTRISDESAFWTLFYMENGAKIQKYLNAIVSTCYDARNDAEFGDDTSIEDLADSLETELEKIAPHVILSNICIDREFVKIPSMGKGSPARNEFKRFGISMNSKNKSLSKENWLTQLCGSLIQFIDMGEVKLITQWGDPDSIYTYSKMSEIINRTPVAVPELPPAWKEFMNGKMLNPQMDLFRISSFVVSALNKKNFSRQALYLCGSGKEGKGIISKCLAHIFGEAAVTINEQQMDPTNRFGLESVVNKRLIMLQDISKPTSIFESPFFKSITGNDTISIERKFKKSFQWKVQGTKIIVVTNKKVWLNNNYSTTRILPIHILRNYENARDVMELSTALIAEEKEFVQWCCDYSKFIKALKNVKGEPFSNYCGSNGIPLWSDEFFNSWLAGPGDDFAYNEDVFSSAAFDAENGDEDFFEIKSRETSAEFDENYFNVLATRLFVFNPASYIAGGDIATTVAQDILDHRRGVPDPIYTILGLNSGERLPQNPVYRAFLDFLREKYKIRKSHNKAGKIWRGLSIKVRNFEGATALNLKPVSTDQPFSEDIAEVL